MTFHKFEDIEAWQIAREMCQVVKNFTDKDRFCADWELKKQIKASSGSAMDCIAEGFERGNKNEFIYFLGVAKGSSGEVRSQAYRALDWGYITEEERQLLDKLAWRVGAAIQGLIKHLHSTDIKGQRYPVKTLHQVVPPHLDTDEKFPSELPPFLQ